MMVAGRLAVRRGTMSEMNLLALPLMTLLAMAAGLVPQPGVTGAPATTTKLEQRYHFDATFRTDTGTLRVKQTISLVNRSNHRIGAVNLSVIPRALGSFSLPKPVRVDGEVVPHSWTTHSNLRVRLGRDVAPDEAFAIALTFKVTPRLQTGAFTARLARQAGVTSFGHWFPIVSREHDSYGIGDPQISYRAESMELELATSTPLPRHAVACPGRREAPNGSGRHWRCRVTDVRDFAFVINPDFHFRDRTVGGTTIRVYTESVGGGVTMKKAAFALRRFNELYGTYPYPDLVLAEVGGSTGFSMEYPRQIHMTRSKVNDTYVIYHEVAHQWFYGLLGNDQMRQPWLDEGFGDFSARYLMGVGANQCSSKNVDVSVFAFPAGLTSGGNWTECQGYFFSVMNKSTEMLNKVRQRMGSADFFAAMRAHIAERRHGITTTRAVLDHLEAWDGANLAPIFEAYTKRY
jgi:hypothetical protein